MHDIIRGSAQRTGFVPALGMGLVLLAGLASSGCGMAGELDDAAQGAVSPPPAVALAPLAVATSSLPAGQPGIAYPATTLRVTPSTEQVAWAVIDGALPQGLELTPDGTIVGTPSSTGVSVFTACATSDERSATRTLAVTVGAFGLVALSGLEDGEAGLDVAVELACLGATGEVRFEVVANGSGGRLGLVDAAAGRATWRTGATPGTTDRLRAIDTVSGAVAETTVAVSRDPTAGFVAEFGSTDVWFVDTGRKTGSHAFATDFQAALAAGGLRQASSTSRQGTRVDRLAETTVRLAMLRHLSLFFLRGADGSRAAGLPVSFPWAEPAGYVRPLDGSWISGGAGRYSVISIVHGSQPGILGTAFTDGTTNGNHENDTTAPGVGELGVFANRFVETVNRAYNNLTLVQAPLCDEDEAVLSDILHGRPTSHVRAPVLRNGIEALGRSIACVVAHEIGHSLGLPHTPQFVSGAIMNSTAVFSPDVDHFFTADEVAYLRGALPGPGRAGGAQKPGVATSAVMMPAGGVTVCGAGTCEGAVCNLRLAEPEHVGTRAPSCGCRHHR
jgi:hypothetical protein